jgi:hypothetical protein
MICVFAGGSCSSEQHFEGWNQTQKEDWSSECSAAWPCKFAKPITPMPDTMPVVGQPGNGRCMAKHGLLIAEEQCARKTSERACKNEDSCAWVGTCWISQPECRFFENKHSGSFEVPYLHSTGRCYAGPTTPADQAKCEKAVRGGGAFDRAVVALGSTDGLVITAADGQIGILQQSNAQALWKLFAVPARPEWYYLQSQSGCAHNEAPCGQWLAVLSPGTADLTLVGADNLDARAKFEFKPAPDGSPAHFELVTRGTGSSDCSELRRRLMSVTSTMDSNPGRRLLGSSPPPPPSPSIAALRAIAKAKADKLEAEKIEFDRRAKEAEDARRAKAVAEKAKRELKTKKEDNRVARNVKADELDREVGRKKTEWEKMKIKEEGIKSTEKSAKEAKAKELNRKKFNDLEEQSVVLKRATEAKEDTEQRSFSSAHQVAATADKQALKNAKSTDSSERAAKQKDAKFVLEQKRKQDEADLKERQMKEANAKKAAREEREAKSQDAKKCKFDELQQKQAKQADREKLNARPICGKRVGWSDWHPGDGKPWGGVKVSPLQLL